MLLLPLRNPTLTAKMTATIDMLSGGRLVLGVGVGGEFPPEFEAVGASIAERGPRANEAIEILRRHWAEGSAEYHGEYYSFGKVNIEPKPMRPGGPPIIVGGRKAVSMKRAGRLGDGYISHMCDVKTYRDNLTSIAAHAKSAGRDGLPFQTTAFLFTLLDDSYEAAHTRATLSPLGRRPGPGARTVRQWRPREPDPCRPSDDPRVPPWCQEFPPPKGTKGHKRPYFPSATWVSCPPMSTTVRVPGNRCTAPRP